MPIRFALHAPITDLNGVQITSAEDPEGLTLRSVLARTALFVEDGKNPDPKVKYAAYQLAKRIMADKSSEERPSTLDFTIEEAASLKAKAGHHWTPLIVGRVWDLMDAPPTEGPPPRPKPANS